MGVARSIPAVVTLRTIPSGMSRNYLPTAGPTWMYALISIARGTIRIVPIFGQSDAARRPVDPILLCFHVGRAKRTAQTKAKSGGWKTLNLAFPLNRAARRSGVKNRSISHSTIFFVCIVPSGVSIFGKTTHRGLVFSTGIFVRPNPHVLSRLKIKPVPAYQPYQQMRPSN